MPLPAKVAKLEDVAETYRQLYKPHGQEFVLEVDGAEDAFAGGLKANRDEALKEAKKLRDQLKAFEGVDAARYRELTEAATKAEEEKAKAAGNWDSMKQQLITEHTKAADALGARVTKRDQVIQKLLAENVVRQALTEAAAIDADLALPHVLPHVRVVETDDPDMPFRAVVVDAKGNERIAGAKGEPLGIAGLVTELKGNPKYGALFKGSGAAGSGATGSQHAAGAAGQVRTRADLKNDAEKAAYIRAHGYKAFTDLPAK